LTGDQPPAVAHATANATSAIQSNLALWSTVQKCLVRAVARFGAGCSRPLVLPSPSGDGRHHMAHGEMVMIGAYVTFVVQETSAPVFPACSTIRC